MSIARGLGAFVDGAFQGYKMGKMYKEDTDQQAYKDSIDQAQKDAESDRARIIDTSVTQNPEVQDMGEDGTPGQVRPATYGVKGMPNKTYATPSEARAAVEPNAPSAQVLFAQRAGPVMSAYYLKQGDVARANAATEWSKGVKGQEYLQSAGSVLAGLHAGDEGAVNQGLAKLTQSYGDGTQFMGAKLDGKGNVTAEYKMPGSDQVTSQTMTTEQAARSFLSKYSPEAGLKMHLEEIAEKRKAQGQREHEIFKGQIQGKLEEVKSGYRREEKKVEHGYRLDEKEADAGLGMERDAAREGIQFQGQVKLEKLKATLKSTSEGKDTTDKDVQSVSGDMAKAVGSAYAAQIKSIDAEIKARSGMGEDTKPLEAKKSALMQRQNGVQSAAGEIVSFTQRLRGADGKVDPKFRDLTPADYHMMGEQLVDAKAGASNNVGLAYDKASGGFVNVFKKGSDVLPITRPVPFDPSDKTQVGYVISRDNKTSDGKPLIPPEQYAKIKGSAAPAAAAAPATPAAQGMAPLYNPATDKPAAAPAPAKPAARGIPTAEAYVPPPDSPAGKAAARRAEAAAAAMAKSREADSKTSAANKVVQDSFAADIGKLSPLELARKYDGQRSSLSTEQRRALQSVEKQIK